MSEESKKKLERIREIYETVEKGSKELIKESEKMDRDLSKKIQKVQEGANEIVKHIEKKVEP